MEGAEGDFLAHRGHEHLPVRLLEHIADKAASLRSIFFCHRGAIVDNISGSRFFQSRKKTGNGGFTAAVASGDGYEFSLVKGEGHPIQNQGQVFGVTERYIFQLKHVSPLLSRMNPSQTALHP